MNTLVAAGFSLRRYRETLYTVGGREKRETAVLAGTSLISMSILCVHFIMTPDIAPPSPDSSLTPNRSDSPLTYCCQPVFRAAITIRAHASASESA
jgi:hypothetical protein